MDHASAADRLQQIESLQDEILAQLADLERRTEAALAELRPPRRPPQRRMQANSRRPAA